MANATNKIVAADKITVLTICQRPNSILTIFPRVSPEIPDVIDRVKLKRPGIDMKIVKGAVIAIFFGEGESVFSRPWGGLTQQIRLGSSLEPAALLALVLKTYFFQIGV